MSNIVEFVKQQEQLFCGALTEQTENSVLHKKCEELQMAVEIQREFIKSKN